MLYLAMLFISHVLAMTANALRVQDESMVDAWIRQQTRLREAIAQAKSWNEPVTQAVSLDDEWIDPWIRQQDRLRQAIAQAKQDNVQATERTER